MRTKMSKFIKKNCLKIKLLGFFVTLQIAANAQTSIQANSPVYQEFVKMEPYISGLVTILVFIGAIRGIQKILRSDPEGKTDLMYAGLGAAAYVGLDLLIKTL